jgi:hypothetical protein
MFMAVRAACQGRVDLTKDWEAVADLVDKLSTTTPYVGVTSTPRIGDMSSGE